MSRGWKKLRSLAGYLLLLLAVITAIDIWRSQDIVAGTKTLGTLTTLDGQVLDLTALSEQQPVLVYVWASWCGVCRWVSPMVSLAARQLPVVGIAVTSGPEEKLTAYVDKHRLKFAVVNDGQARLARTLGIGVTPTLMVASHGKLDYITTGFTTLPGMFLRIWLAHIGN
ncbi:redoxin domain-containing protein [Zobellella aerophila]|uniref:Protein disulfide oxidoreductase n=1 Tax=Zobellella aerophila TaxID=870480 RepID=A0ABP6VPA0_9GAMM